MQAGRGPAVGANDWLDWTFHRGKCGGKVQSRAWPFSPLLCHLENGDEKIEVVKMVKSPTFMQNEFLHLKILLL